MHQSRLKYLSLLIIKNSRHPNRRQSDALGARLKFWWGCYVMAIVLVHIQKQRLVSYFAVRQKKHPAYNIFNTSDATCWRLFYKIKNMNKAKEPAYRPGRQKTERYERMPVVNPSAAGIDVGSSSHFVAIGQNKEDVKEFGVFTKDLNSLCQHLVSNKITTVALESTGSHCLYCYSNII